MGVELRILGIRKIRDEEIEELFGKSEAEIENSKYFRELFPKAPYDSGYWCFPEERLQDESLENVKHMMSPVLDPNGRELYVFWTERLGYYWHKSPYDRERIEQLLEDTEGYADWDQSFHVVPYDRIRAFMDRRPMIKNKHEEIIAFLYG